MNAWTKTRVTEKLGIDLPLLQGGMAGGPTTPQLVAAVSNAGGLGTLGGGYLSPEQIREAIREIRTLTKRPFAVNLFVQEPVREVPMEQVEEVNRLMQPYRNELGLEGPPTLTQYAELFTDQLAVVIEEKVPVFAFTFGIPSPEWMTRLQEAGIMTIGQATTVREAVLLEQSGVDLIVGSGSEAGGHRGTFLEGFERSMVGTMALIPQMVDNVTVPVIAAGGIMDGRGMAAAFMLGAEAVQLGTAFLTSIESGVHPKYKEALLNSSDESTMIIRSFSGRPARGLRNRFAEEMRVHDAGIPPYPIQNALTRDIRQAAAKQNRTEFMSLWAGQGVGLTEQQSAAELVAKVVEQADRLLGT